MKTILIVDDELSILKMLSDYLKSKYQIVTAINFVFSDDLLSII